MRKLIVSEFITLDGVIQAPGGEVEDRDGGFAHGGWTLPFWHDDIGKTFGSLMQDTDALLLGRRTYVTHAQAFEPMPAARWATPLWPEGLASNLRSDSPAERNCSARSFRWSVSSARKDV